MKPSDRQSIQNSQSWFSHWLPFLIWGKSLNRRSLSADLLAGLTGAVVVLPQGVAYALIAGLPPEYGLYTAIITPIVAGLFGSSLHLISGPTAAISIVVLSVVSSVVPPDSSGFIPAVLTLTLLAGVIQFALGIAGLGTLVNFISHTVVIGFTAGAAILIATSQLKYVLGVDVPTGASFAGSWSALLRQLDVTNTYSLIIAVSTIFSTLLLKRINPRLPTMLFGMVTGAVVCWVIDGASHGVPLVGALPGNLPGFSLPDLSYGTVTEIIPGAIAVAILGLVEAVSIARAIAIRSGQRIEGNQEFIGQGLSNIVGSFFSCYAGSGSFTRSGVNYDSGARSPMSGIFAALFLVAILLLAPEITAFLPLPAMAGAILLIAANLIDFHHIKQILRSNRQEATVLAVTFFSTLIVELEFAIYLGVILSLTLYLRRTSKPRVMEVAPKSFEYGTDLRSIQRFQLEECPQLKILRIDGSIFFGAVDHIQRTLQKHSTEWGEDKPILLVCSGINFIDVAGAEMLIQESIRLKSTGGKLTLCALKNTVKDELKSAGYLSRLGEESFYATVDEALSAIVEELVPAQCAICTKRVFQQCPPAPMKLDSA
ncbi:MAG: SulP family inorganic anion transporter [Motiliproteus sp.]|nr:SulP family inorganic anion transporter [Motiliproteus sp.]MCW9051634.1 SulP family inorganic anion transporter [Motiliproteus sp.]